MEITVRVVVAEYTIAHYTLEQCDARRGASGGSHTVKMAKNRSSLCCYECVRFTVIYSIRGAAFIRL